MFHTFGYDNRSHQLLIASKVYSDFASHIPLIRSFSVGVNWPPQYPLYPGEKIRYHFLFYAFTGLLEKSGLRIDLALNLLSALGFLCLCLLILIFAARLFSSLSVGLLSLLFFLFNGSLSVVDFIKNTPFSFRLLDRLIHLENFVSFGPWNGSPVTAFWNLNIYTNQRHLGLSFALVLLIFIILVFPARKLLPFIGFMLGSLLFLNQAAILPALIIIGWMFIIEKHLRLPLVFSAMGFLPWYFLSRLLLNLSPQIGFQPGYLISGPLTVFSFVRFWFLNLGLHLFLIPAGLFLAPRRIRRILLLPLLLLFITPNLLRFSPDMINNHKIFNFFLIIGSPLSAFTLSRIWRLGRLGKTVSVLLCLILISGGVVDFFPVKNDYYVRISDVAGNPDAAFFAGHTPPDAVILNSTWLYHPASLAGRPVFNGYSYFTWSYGYDQSGRENTTIAIYASRSKLAACRLLVANHISYVELSPRHESFLQPDFGFWQSAFTRVYDDPASGLSVYSVNRSCQSL